MTDGAGAAYAADDAILLYLVRDGDTEAFRALWQRHEEAARRLARCLVSADQVDDVVAEAHDRILGFTLRGGGPADAFRPYLLTAVRRVSRDRLHQQHRGVPAGLGQLPDPGELLIDPSAADLQTSVIVRAFRSLPERWIAVLWHTEIEQADPARLGPILGLAPDEVETLRRLAWDGLRQVYLGVQISDGVRRECQPVVQRLAAQLDDATASRDSEMVTEHLNHCDDCRAIFAQLNGIDIALHSTVSPVFLGSAAASYLSAEPATEPDAAAAGAAAAGTAVTAGQPDRAEDMQEAPTGQAGRRHAAGRPRLASRRVLAPVAAAVAVLAIVVTLALTIPRAGTSPAHRQTLAGAAGTPAGAAQSPGGKPQQGTGSTGPATHPGSSPAAVSASPASAAPAPASPRSAPAASPVASPTPGTDLSTTLSASVDVQPDHANTNVVAWTVTDTGTAATGGLDVVLSLPSGVSWSGSQVSGWTCQQAAEGASCQSGALSPGGQAAGTMTVIITPESCNQPVVISVAAGNAAAQVSSVPNGISCGGERQ